MSAFLTRLFTLFCQKLHKKGYLHCIVKFQLRELGCALTWYENAAPQLLNFIALQLNQKAHCESCAAPQKLRKINCAFRAALLLLKNIVALLI